MLASKPTSGLSLRAMIVRVGSRMKIVRGAFSSGGASSSRTYSSDSKRFCGFHEAPRP